MTTTTTAAMAAPSLSVYSARARTSFNYARFRHIIRKLINKKITRERFAIEWGTEQREQKNLF